jgi:hypothetical protein
MKDSTRIYLGNEVQQYYGRFIGELNSGLELLGFEQIEKEIIKPVDKDMSSLMKQLIDKRFNGKSPEWKKGTLPGGISIQHASDEKNVYIRHGEAIYVQKQGRGDMTCFKCGSDIQAQEQSVSVWYKEFSGPVGGGEVETKTIPYCPKCEKAPPRSSVRID